jgi:hypothetical protein
MRSSYIALLATVSLLAACAAPVTGSAEESSGADLSSASSSGLSQDLVCAAVSAANDHFAGEALSSFPQSKLQGDALHDFKSWQKDMLPDYPSAAFYLPVKLGTKTYTFLMVTENNDGGGAVGVYRTDGSVVATDLYSESENNPWSSPADQCPDSNG